MNLYNRITAKLGWHSNKTNTVKNPVTNLAAETKEKDKRHLPYNLKAVSRVRQDIGSWNIALATAQSDEPKNYPIQLLYKEICIDALLTSQMENRKNPTLSSPFSLKDAKGEKDEEQTAILKKLAATRDFNVAGLESIWHGNTLVELSLTKNIDGGMEVSVITIPRTNVVQQTGLFYPDYSEDKTIKYRELAEFGTWILEFNSGDLGLLNKAVPHILFKRFAQSCWSELCEIYGIPPRVMKTDTQDTVMLNRAEKMMEDMGAAAWYIIDESEEFEWATGVSTDGNVYKNLINLCSNEVCLLFTGAVIGQDTVNGNRSKEESSQNLLADLIQSDKALLEIYWNTKIIPALVKLGILKAGVRFEFDPSEDIKQLWSMTKDAMQHMKVDVEWVKSKFGIEVTGERETPVDKKLGAELLDFFV